MRKKYLVQGNKLIIDSTEISFDYPIDICVDISDMIIVLLDIPGKIKYNENVFGVNLFEKEIKWQIAKRKFRFESIAAYKNLHCNYNGMSVYGGILRLNNWCDTFLIVDPLTGEILDEGETR